MADLVLLRHGESEWNKLNLFTGWRDVELSPRGIDEATAAGRLIAAAGARFDVAFTSKLKRARQTLDGVLAESGMTLPITEHQALNERDYGDLTGLNKDDARARWGEDQVLIWRRSYDVPPPGGESLKDTAARVIPYFEAEIEPHITQGRRVLVVAHGNSLRALIMRLENLTPEEVIALNLATGHPVAYRFAAGSFTPHALVAA